MNIGAVERKMIRKVPIWFTSGVGDLRFWYVLRMTPQDQTTNVAADRRQKILAK
jgi:hypothetical protein